MNGRIKMPEPVNEVVQAYSIGSVEQKKLLAELSRQESEFVRVPLIINGEEIYTDRKLPIRCPHRHELQLGEAAVAGEKEIKNAINASLEAKKKWERLSWRHRAAIFLKIAELISKKYRFLLNAATMLNQSKSAHQAEIDAACELTDFLRFNIKFTEEIYENQPRAADATLDYMEYRSLDGFVLAISPFNFTAIAGNLTTAPAMLGNTVVWKPSSNALLSGYYLMKIFKEAGLPDGVINFIPTSGSDISKHALTHQDLAGIHFTGSTEVFTEIWKQVAENLQRYKSFPRLVGETGGKNYILMDPTAQADAVVTALIRGGFEYQGQKCSACSRAYIPQSRWEEIREKLVSNLASLRVGDVSDFGNFMNGVIDDKSYHKTMAYINRAIRSDDAEIVFGGSGDKAKGYFIEPTVIQVSDPHYETMREELFAPVLSIYVYPDESIDDVPELIEGTTPYALTGSVFGNDPYRIELLFDRLKGSCGNFYINDKPTGAVVGRQPFGGSRASGTNDKAGSHLNLLRWISPRTVKECLNPPIDYRYPHMIRKL